MLGPEAFDDAPARKVPLLQAFGRNEQAVLLYRFIVALEDPSLDELKSRAERLQAFRLKHYRELPDDYAGVYRRWWAEIQFWQHYNKRLRAGR